MTKLQPHPVTCWCANCVICDCDACRRNKESLIKAALTQQDSHSGLGRAQGERGEAGTLIGALPMKLTAQHETFMEAKPGTFEGSDFEVQWDEEESSNAVQDSPRPDKASGYSGNGSTEPKGTSPIVRAHSGSPDEAVGEVVSQQVPKLSGFEEAVAYVEEQDFISDESRRIAGEAFEAGWQAASFRLATQRLKQSVQGGHKDE